MKKTESRPSASGMDAVAALIARRSSIQGWLDRLAEFDDEIPARVQARVRVDYEQRLEEVTHQLAAHQDALRQELARISDDLDGATAAFDEASDALAEARLRHRIGELEEDEWERRRPELEAEVSRARERRDHLAGEADRLQELLELVEGEAASTEPVEAAAPEPVAAPAATEQAPDDDVLAAAGLDLAWTAPDEPEAEEDEPLPILEIAEQIVAAGEESAELSDFAFLEELDRAIAQSGTRGAVQPETEVEVEVEVGGEETNREPDSFEESAPSAPAKGVKCLECGYTNDANAWYCGVCGVDLA
jgi:hypothetical protein